MTLEIDDIKTLSLRPGQILIVKVNAILSRDQVDHIVGMFAGFPELKGRVMVMDKSLSVAVVDASGVSE